MLRLFFVLTYLSTALSFITIMFLAWMFAVNTKFRFRNKAGSLSVVHYVYGIIWRTTILRMVMVASILYQGITLLLPPAPSEARIENIVTRLIASVVVLTTIVAFSVMDNPNLTDSNEQLQKDYEADVRKAVKEIIVR